MFAKATLVALVGALAVSAVDKREIAQLVTRQISQASVPAACQTQCTGTITIYDACLNGDTNTCLTVCQSATYSSFVGCFQCIVDNTDGITASDVSSLNAAIGQLDSACSSAGETVPATSITLGSNGSTATDDSGSSASTDSLLSFTSNAAGETIGSDIASTTAALTSAVARTSAVALTSAAATHVATTSAAAVATSKAALSGGIVGAVPNVASALAFGLVAVGAGAAFVL